MEQKKELAERRRANLKNWLEANNISGTEFAALLKVGRAYVSLLHRPDRFFGARAARNIEEKLSMPQYYLDGSGLAEEATQHWKSPAELSDDMQGLVPRIDLVATPEGLQHQHRRLPYMAFTKAWLQHKKVNSPELLRCFTATDDAMAPYVVKGDLVLLDLSQTAIQDGEVYAVQHLGQIRLRRLNQGVGGLILHVDNPIYPQEQISAEQAQGLVLGRCLWRAG